MLQPGDTVLDVGAGRCAMSLPLRPPASRIVAVDASAAMLEDSPADMTILGRWPDVAAEVEPGAVVVCGHVLYNVAELGPFVDALTRAARRRVVVEITASHPREREVERALWRHFWGLERPHGPTWQDAVAVMRERGIEPQVERWQLEVNWGMHTLDDLVAHLRQGICLPPERDAEVRSVVLEHVHEVNGAWPLSNRPRELVTLWWDGAAEAR